MAVRREIHPVRHCGGFRSPVHQLHLAVAVQLIDCSKASQPRPCKHRGILMEQRQRRLSKRRGMDPPTQPAAASDTSRHSSGAARAALSCCLPNHEEVPSRTQARSEEAGAAQEWRTGTAHSCVAHTSPQSVPRDPSPTRCPLQGFDESEGVKPEFQLDLKMATQVKVQIVPLAELLALQ